MIGSQFYEFVFVYFCLTCKTKKRINVSKKIAVGVERVHLIPFIERITIERYHVSRKLMKADIC